MNALGRRLFIVGALVACAGGCASTTLHSGKAPGDIARGYDAAWHPSFLFGSVPYNDSYRLDEACPNGWSEVRLNADAFSFGISLLTAFLYTPSRLTIVCAASDPTKPPVLHEYAAPGTETEDSEGSSRAEERGTGSGGNSGVR